MTRGFPVKKWFKTLAATCAVIPFAQCAMAPGGNIASAAEPAKAAAAPVAVTRSEEQTFELQSLMRISYAVFCLKKKKKNKNKTTTHHLLTYNMINKTTCNTKPPSC